MSSPNDFKWCFLIWKTFLGEGYCWLYSSSFLNASGCSLFLVLQSVCIKWLLCISCSPPCWSISLLALCSFPSYLFLRDKILTHLSFKFALSIPFLRCRLPQTRNCNEWPKPNLILTVQSQKLSWGICKTSLCAHCVNTEPRKHAICSYTGRNPGGLPTYTKGRSDPCKPEERCISWKIWCASALYYIVWIYL